MVSTHRAIVVAFGVGIAIGAIAIQTLHAQSKPPVYVVVDIAAITDPDGYKAISQVPKPPWMERRQNG